MAKKRQLKPRDHNHGTMTFAGKMGMLRSGMRRMNMRNWKPNHAALQEAKRPYEGDNKRRKYSYECAGCKGLFSRKEVDVDHIVPAGSLNSYEDLPGFVQRLFCEVDNLQVLCKTCHKAKTHDKSNKD